jgi:hypothetical protein
MQDHLPAMYNHNVYGPNRTYVFGSYVNNAGGWPNIKGEFAANNAGPPRFSNETRPGSLSAYLCIKY